MPTKLTPRFLLDNPDLVQATAPWCVVLDNLDLALLLLSQPWLAGDGLRRADLERQLQNLRTELPVGAVYFQRIKRAVAKLEELGAMSGAGGGRSRRFTMTPAGFGALVVNLSVLRADPTIDASEFELKRTIASMWNLALERLGELPEASPTTEMDSFITAVMALTVLGEHVLDQSLVDRSLDVLELVGNQKRRVVDLRDREQVRLEQISDESTLLRAIDLGRLGAVGFEQTANLLARDSEALKLVRRLALGGLPALGIEARLLRYEHYLGYLEELHALYTRELSAVDLRVLRKAGRSAAGR